MDLFYFETFGPEIVYFLNSLGARGQNGTRSRGDELLTGGKSLNKLLNVGVLILLIKMCLQLCIPHVLQKCTRVT